jgi:hypothetical protein
MPLSPREQRILAGIENELDAADPGLAATLAQPRALSLLGQRYPLSASHTWLLVLALVMLVLLHPLALDLGPIAVGMLTAALIVPWLVSAARAVTGTASRSRRRVGRGLFLKVLK